MKSLLLSLLLVVGMSAAALAHGPDRYRGYGHPNYGRHCEPRYYGGYYAPNPHPYYYPPQRQGFHYDSRGGWSYYYYYSR